MLKKGIPLKEFEALGLSPAILQAISKLGYERPTPIQKEAVPLVLEGHDLMGLAQTGTGKTAAFGLPLIQRLMEENEFPAPRSVRGLILAPTRELANQIAESLRGFVRGTPLRISVIVGGMSIGTQIRNMQRGTDIMVATPGRLLDLVERKAVNLRTTRFLVLDEADQMLDLGFIHSLRQIARLLGTPRQTLLFSATMPKLIEELSQSYLTDPVRVEVTPPGRAADKIRQTVHFVGQRDKASLLRACLGERPEDRSIVFARTKHGAEKLMKHLVESGFAAGSIHGNKSQGQRVRAIKAFKDGEIRVLVATDVAARGIDISGVSHVYNYDLPEVPENYVHRIGRTARAGAEGQAVAFCSPADTQLLKAIEKLMGSTIHVSSGERPEELLHTGRGQGPKRNGQSRNGQNRAGQNRNGPKRDGAPRAAGKKGPKFGNRAAAANQGGEGERSEGRPERRFEDRADGRAGQRHGGQRHGGQGHGGQGHGGQGKGRDGQRQGGGGQAGSFRKPKAASAAGARPSR